MRLKEKYKELIDYAKQADISGLSISENNNVLYISGASSESAKSNMWDIYNKIDPDMRSGDLILNIEIDPNAEEIYEIAPGDNLSKIAGKYPGMTWQKIYEANKNTIKDPNKIFPGQKIKIPV